MKLEFKDVTLDLREEYNRLSADIPVSFYRFSNMFMTRAESVYKYARVGDGIVVASFMNETPHVMLPLCSDVPAAIDVLKEELEFFVLEPLTDKMVAELRAQNVCLVTRPAPEYSDYIYDAEALRTLAGNAYHKKRNHANKFASRYDAKYVPLTQENARELCLPLLEKWYGEKGGEAFDERTAVSELIENFDALELRGAALTVEGSVVAFTIGELIGEDTAHIIIEKADTSYDGSYAAINRAFLVNEFPDAKYVNREEDLGIPGLRKAKMSYRPIARHNVCISYMCRCNE